MKLGWGKWLGWIQLRVSRSETLVIAPVGRSRSSPELGCARTPSRTSFCEELELQGLLCNLSATQGNSNRTHIQLVKNPRPFLKIRQHAGAGALSFWGWAAWAETSPRLFSLFLFLFQKNFINP
jgi:hypothetical protein